MNVELDSRHLLENWHQDFDGLSSLSKQQQDNIRYLEKCINRRWGFGQNIVLSWCSVPGGVKLLLVPHYFLGNYSAHKSGEIISDRPADEMVMTLISGKREMSLAQLMHYSALLSMETTDIKLPAPMEYNPTSRSLIEEIVRRYSVNYVPSRAVILFDIAGFVLLEPFEQMSQLNSLAYSLNSAHKKLQKRNINIKFARSTTGDGFYVWNRSEDIFANINLFQFLHLVLADNAISLSKSKGRVTPKIRAAYQIGSHYEFYQAEGIRPSYYSYIVGDVTIQLARMLEHVQPGQIIIGHFKDQFPTSCSENAYLVESDTIGFISRAEKYLNQLKGMQLSEDKISALKCYLTGEQSPAGGLRKSRIKFVDKHQRSHYAYNIRMHIYRHNSATIFLGLEDNEIPTTDKVYTREASLYYAYY